MSQERKSKKDGRPMSKAGGYRDTYVYPQECVSQECFIDVGNEPQIVHRPIPKPVYLEYQVLDLPPSGFSNTWEIREVAEQILQDVQLNVITVGKGVHRLQAIRMHVNRFKKDDLSSPEIREQAHAILNEYVDKVRLVKTPQTVKEFVQVHPQYFGQMSKFWNRGFYRNERVNIIRESAVNPKYIDKKWKKIPTKVQNQIVRAAIDLGYI
jgi:hypothetical protein